MNLTAAQSTALIQLSEAGSLIRSRTRIDGGVTNRTAGVLLANKLANESTTEDGVRVIVPTARGNKLAAKLVANTAPVEETVSA